MPPAVIGAIIVGAVVEAVAAPIIGALAATIVGGLAAAGTAMLLGPSYESENVSAFADVSRTRTLTAREPVAPWRIIYGQTRLGGAITYLEGSNNNQYLHLVITLSGHELEEITTVYFDNDALTLDGSGNVTAPSKYAGFARIKKSLGSEAGQPFADLVTESNGLWTNSHLQTGRGKIYVRLLYDGNAFPNGIPNITALVKGRKVYDPRSATTVWSDNAALCFNDYLTNASFGAGVDYATQVDEAALIAAANVCDEAVTLDAGGTEDRYTCNGVIEVATSPEDVLPRLASCMAGRFTYVSGTWTIYAGAYVTPSIELTVGDLRGPIQVETLLSKRDLFNSVRGVFIDPNRLYQATDFPPVTSASYIAQDNDEELWMNMDLPFTQSGATAQRIAKIELERVRQQISIQLQCKFGAYRLIPGDTFLLTLDKYGWNQKPFEVSEVSFVVQDDILGVNITARETASAVYDWSTADEGAIDPAPNTQLPDPFTVGSPSNIVVTESLYESTGSSGVKVQASVSWDVPNDWFSQSGLAVYQLEYKLSSDSNWNVVTNIKDPPHIIQDIAPGRWDFRVKAQNVRGVLSDYATLFFHLIAGLTAPPSDVTSFHVHPSGGFARLNWALHPDIDVRIGGKIEVRHSTSVSSSRWQDSVLMDRFDGLAVEATAPLVTGTYLAKARDTAFVYSTSPAVFTITEGLILPMTLVASIVEHPTFTGTKVNLTVTGGHIELTDPSSMFATYYWPGSRAAFPSYVDLGSAAARRFESDVMIQRYDDSDLIDDRGLVDTWPDIDGGVVDRGDVLMYVRTTDDDPAGTPTWSPWNLFRVAELNCRAAQFKLEFEVTSATHNISVDDLAMHIKVPT